MNKQIKTFFIRNLLLYYQKNKRELPWRDTKDPYKIWISEILLQQTQVKQALDYYYRFIEQFPNIQALAQSSEKEILHLWQGLGYYSRARNMHYAARQIIDEFNGCFPNNYQDLLKLKGIGEYTAAAIASFAYNLPYAVLDGNVFRVISRFFGIDTPIDTHEGKKTYKNLADELLDKNNPSEYNQAIMEFGATYCKPQNPDCPNCLLQKHCIAYHSDKVHILPIKSKKIQKKSRYFNYFIFIENKKYVYIQKRNQSDIWRGLYEFYLVEHTSKLLSKKEIEKHLKARNIECKNIIQLSPLKHILTHQEIHIQFNIISINHSIQIPLLKKIPIRKIKEYPFPVVIKKLLDKLYMYI